MAASNLEISQFSVSVNIRTFMADRMLEYSFISFLPSHTVQFPWMTGQERKIERTRTRKPFTHSLCSSTATRQISTSNICFLVILTEQFTQKYVIIYSFKPVWLTLVSNLYDLFSSMEHKRRNFEECPGCLFPHNEGEWELLPSSSKMTKSTIKVS